MQRLLFVLLLVAGAASAQTNPYQLKGFTAATFPGNAGVLAFTAACQAEFGTAARMCASVEVLQTVVIPGGLSGAAWVRPVFEPLAVTSSGSGASILYAADASGVSAAAPNLACAGWSEGVITAGLIVDALGHFSGASCSSIRPVSCCAPIPLPEPTSMLMNGVGFAAVVLLSSSKGG